MTGDLVSVRVLAISDSAAERELWRRAAGQIAVPIDIIEVEDVAAACKALALSVQDIDVAFLDSELADRAAFIEAARAARQRPFVILVAAANGASTELAAPGIDAVVTKPATLEQAKAMIGRCVRVRLPSRWLEIAEAEDGIQALKQIGTGRFDFVVLDYNMPGLNGVETLSEIKRQYPRVGVVIMSSAQHEGVAERARAAGAAAFLKKPFYASDIDAVLHSVYRLQTPSPPGA